MLLFLYHDKKISVDTIILCRMSLSRHLQLHSRLYSGRNLHLDSFASADKACTATCTAWISYNLSFTTTLLTSRISISLAENAVDNSLYLTCTITSRASLYVRTVLCTSSATIRARHILLNTYLLLDSSGDFLQSKLYAHSDITASVDSLLLTLSASAEAEAESRTEQIIQDIVDISESTAEIWSGAFYSCMPELVILGLLIRITEHRICLSSLFELLLCLLISRILVGMIFNSQLPVGLLYFIC